MTTETKRRPSVFWMRDVPLACDCCGIGIHSVFIDGATQNGGPWGCLHPVCHARIGVGLGVGRGQRYDKQPDGRWLRTEG